MRWFRFLLAVSLAGPLICAAEGPDTKPNESKRVVTTSGSVARPPVLRTAEPVDNVVFTLPGAPPKEPITLAATIVRLAPPDRDPERPILRRPERNFPAGFEQDSAEFLQSQIGKWGQADAQLLMGEPSRQRPAYGDDQVVNGQIVAFPDPTSRYRELELDFDKDSGQLRTVFAYPFTMTWQECRRSFGVNVRAAEANKGRIFYSYLNRRLDVLVDPAGKVISLGFY